MEAFEHIVKIHLETKGYVVSSGIKFPVTRMTGKRARPERQTHGYEADLVGARAGELLLCSVKSYFGSHGVSVQGFAGIADRSKPTHFERYVLFNNAEVREGMLDGASKRYGYRRDQIRFRLFVGKFKSRRDRERVSGHLRTIIAGGGPIEVVTLEDLLPGLLERASESTYVNDPVLVTLKMLRSVGWAPILAGTRNSNGTPP